MCTHSRKRTRTRSSPVKKHVRTLKLYNWCMHARARNDEIPKMRRRGFALMAKTESDVFLLHIDNQK